MNAGQIGFTVFVTIFLLVAFGGPWVHRRSLKPHGRTIAFLEKTRRILAYEPLEDSK